MEGGEWNYFAEYYYIIEKQLPLLEFLLEEFKLWIIQVFATALDALFKNSRNNFKVLGPKSLDSSATIL